MNPTIGALPWYKSPVQIAQTASFISGLVALSPKNSIFLALGLTNPDAVTTDVTAIFAVIALLAGAWGLIVRARSQIQPLTLSQAKADAHPATAAAIDAGTLSVPMAKSESQIVSKSLALLVMLPFVGVLLGIVACQTVPNASGTPTTVQNFQQLYQAGVAADDLVLVAGNTALNTHLISAPQAAQVLRVTDAVKGVLDAAELSYKAGNIPTATTNLAKATSILTVLSSCITQVPLTIDTFATCSSNLATPTVTP